MNTETLIIIFINQRHDLIFVSKFQEISEICKNISEYWLEESLDWRFAGRVNIRRYKHLRKLDCTSKVTDADLLHLPRLIYLNIGRSITNQGVMHLHLTSLILDYNDNITNEGIIHMPLQMLSIGGYSSKITDDGILALCKTLKVLHVWGNPKITNHSIRQLSLVKLIANDNKNITDYGIFNMTTLKILSASRNCGITDLGLRKLDLEHLTAYDNPNITKEGIKHMTNCQFFQV